MIEEKPSTQPNEKAFVAGGSASPAENGPAEADSACVPLQTKATVHHGGDPSDPYSKVPQELKLHPNWVDWKDQTREGEDERTKVPYNPNTGERAKSNDSRTWATFQNAVSAAHKYSGIGFMLKTSDYAGLDFDGVIHEGVVDPYVLEILRQLGNPYAEITPSGKGIRAFVKGTLPPGKRKFGRSKPEKYGAEIYSGSEGGRYLTVTGKWHSGHDVPHRSNLAVPYLLCCFFLDQNFRRLWMGDTTGYDGDDSRADLALLGILAREFNNDPVRMETAFNQCRLAQREKWQTRPDYRTRTIQKALHGSSRGNEGKDEAQGVLLQLSCRVFNLEEFLELKIPPSEPMLGPLLKDKSIVELYAWRGVGKTYFSTAMGLAVAGAGKFLKWKAPRPRRVLYLDGEMAGDEFQGRLRELTEGMEVEIDPYYFFPMNFDTQAIGLVPNIAEPEGQRIIEDLIGETEAELVVFDNLSCLARIGDLDDVAWLPISSWLLSLRRKGIASLLDHHANKTGGQRGISRREDPFNVVMKLAHPKNYQPEEGLRCNLTFEKSRGFKGDDAKPLEIQLTGGEGRPLVWTFCHTEEALPAQVAEMLAQGLSFRDIAEELGISKSTLCRMKQKADSKRQGKPEPATADSDLFIF